jgi:hypothetical protein
VSWLQKVQPSYMFEDRQEWLPLDRVRLNPTLRTPKLWTSSSRLLVASARLVTRTKCSMLLRRRQSILSAQSGQLGMLVAFGTSLHPGLVRLLVQRLWRVASVPRQVPLLALVVQVPSPGIWLQPQIFHRLILSNRSAMAPSHYRIHRIIIRLPMTSTPPHLRLW